MADAKRAKTKLLSVRFTEAELEAIALAAGQKSKSGFVRDCALSKVDKSLRRKTETYSPSEQRTNAAQILALLGKYEIAANLNELSTLARLGALPVTTELEAQLEIACTDIASIKAILMTMLGLKER